MSYVVVLPYVWEPYKEACLKTCKIPSDNLLLVDNTVHNVGIMKAHNMGIDFMWQKNADWLVIMSAAVRFGRAGGLDFVKLLDANSDHYVIHAATDNVVGGKQQDEESGGKNGVFGWHLTAFHREVFASIGRWDCNFSPYGFDDIDLSIRIQKHFKGARGWDTFPVDVTDTTMAHSINLGGVRAYPIPRMAYFQAKWGRTVGAWQDRAYDYPFNRPENSLAYWPTAPNGDHWDD